jgi:hypothetical protein
MSLLPDLLLLALVGVISLGLAAGLVCLIIGMHCDDRAGLDSRPGGMCARLARRVTGLHVIGSHHEG